MSNSMEEFKNISLPWPDWKIVKYLGGGAYGKVYEIERNISGFTEKAALKIISKPRNQEEIESYYYAQEYKILKELQGQTNIVSCDDFTIVPNENGIGGKIFIRMELLIPLQQVLRERNLSEEEIVRMGKDLASALILCERKHVIHRDIKPANIMISKEGNFKLGGFEELPSMVSDMVMGTTPYQAPEVVHEEKYDHTSDIYSLGIILYWLLNHRRMPFINAEEKLTPYVMNKAIEMRYRGELLPAPEYGTEELKKIVLKACAYRPENRYSCAEEFYYALNALIIPTEFYKYLPEKKMIQIKDVRDDSYKGGDYFGLHQLPAGAYMEYNASNEYQKYEKIGYSEMYHKLFAESYHPFLQKYSSNPRHCAEILSHYFSRPSHRFVVFDNMFLTVFDMGGDRNSYKETPNYITYRQISQESYHDGGGSYSQEWYLYAAKVSKCKAELTDKIGYKHFSALPQWVFLPDCRGFWTEEGHVYVVDPWDMCGIFEFYCHTEEKELDEEANILDIGMPYRVSCVENVSSFV